MRRGFGSLLVVPFAALAIACGAVTRAAIPRVDVRLEATSRRETDASGSERARWAAAVWLIGKWTTAAPRPARAGASGEERDDPRPSVAPRAPCASAALCTWEFVAREQALRAQQVPR